jgi:hypothetical protein
VDKLSEFQIIGRVRTLIRKQYEKEHPDWEENIMEIIDKPVRNTYIDGLVDEVDTLLEGVSNNEI